MGAEVVTAPVARQESPLSWDGLDHALNHLSSFDWVVFTSANAVRFTRERLMSLGRDARSFSHCRIAVIGPGTNTHLARYGLRADLIPDHFDAHALGQAMVKTTPTAARVFLPQADNARALLRQELNAAGCSVTTAEAYRTIAVPFTLDLELPVDAVTFASSATVERFIAGLGTEQITALTARGCRYYAIGTQTADTMTARGLPIAAIAAEATIPALVQAVVTDLGTAQPTA